MSDPVQISEWASDVRGGGEEVLMLREEEEEEEEQVRMLTAVYNIHLSHLLLARLHSEQQLRRHSTVSNI